MRRSSIVGPLILIAVGVLFLLRNFLPEFRVVDIISLYWPWLLIGWGSLRVIEVLVWHQKGQLTPRGGMNGGEWTLVIFICLIGSGMFAARNNRFFQGNRLNIASWELMGESFDYSIAGLQTGVGKTPRILIENNRGNTRITGVDAEEVRVTGTKTVRALTRDDATREDKLSNFEIVRSGDQYIIRTNLDRSGNSRQAKADLEITVPKGAIVECRGKYGDFDVENLNGNLEVSSDNAGVRANTLGGSVRIDLRRSDVIRLANIKGTVDIKGRGQDVELENIAGATSVNGQYSGDLKFAKLDKPFRFESKETTLRVERVEGEISMALGKLTARKISGPLQLTGKSKDVELTDFNGTVDIDLDRGDIELRPLQLPMSKISARTKSGEAQLILPAGSRLDLKAEVKRGRIENDFGGPFKLSEEGRASTLSGSLGGPEVRIDVDRGNIHVRKAGSESPEPPVTPKSPNAPAKPSELEVTKQ